MAVNVTPRMQLIDLKTGQLTRDGYLLLASLNDSIQDATSDFVRLDATQTITNKTIDGDANTFSDIPTTALATKTGDGTRVVTADAAGTDGRLAIWDADGNLASSVDPDDYTTTAALTILLDAKQTAGEIVILPEYTVATVPDPTLTDNGIIIVSDEAGGRTIATSDGTDWCRVSDGAVIS